MHEIKSHADELARMKARSGPSLDERLGAMETSLSSLIRRVDGVVSRADARHYDDDRRDDDRARDDEMKRLRDDNARMKKELDDRAKKDARDTLFGKRKDMKQAEDADVEEEREEAEEQHEKDDDKRDDDNEGEPEEMASDDDRRGDSVHQRLARLERNTRSRVLDSDYLNALAQKQADWDRVAQMHGQRAGRPLDGERVESYDRRMARVFQKFSPKWQGEDLGALPASVIIKNVGPEVRADAVAAAYRADPSPNAMQREVRRQDQSGRWISEFVGPVGAVNGALAPFRMQPYRCRVNPDPSKYS